MPCVTRSTSADDVPQLLRPLDQLRKRPARLITERGEGGASFCARGPERASLGIGAIY